ncbi:MAG: ABC transporter substrate-binding protein, partial [Acidimicrobiales bacterium]
VGKTVGFIGQNDDFGTDGLGGLLAGGLQIAKADQLTYNAADAITGSSSDIVVDVKTLQADNAQVVVLDSVPGFTAGILAVAHQLGYTPQWVISSVGSDPTSVNSPLEAGAISLDYFPASNNNRNPWIPWIRKVLLADKTDFPTFSAHSVITGNMLYGAGYAVSFAEALKAAGRNVTRAGLVKAMLKTKFATPAITPLKYGASNHQGLQGGLIATVASNGTSAPTQVIEPNTLVYTTSNTASSSIHIINKLTVSPIPAWLK